MVYVRQSTPQQVLENRESRERQYALAQFAERLGWPAERVVVIDEDQGQSGKTAAERSGFQRLMTEVSLNHVGHGAWGWNSAGCRDPTRTGINSSTCVASSTPCSAIRMASTIPWTATIGFSWACEAP